MCVGSIEISSFTFELVTDMTVFPQQFTLNCVKIGTEHFNYSLYLYLYNETLEITSDVNCGNMMTTCTSGNRTLQDMNDYAYLHSVNLTWDTVAVSNSTGSFNKLSNGDHEYQCEINIGEISSLQTVTVKGNN